MKSEKATLLLPRDLLTGLPIKRKKAWMSDWLCSGTFCPLVGVILGCQQSHSAFFFMIFKASLLIQITNINRFYVP